MYPNYIFDLDGTLINSLEDLADASNFVLREAGLPTHPVDAYRYFVGNGAYKLAERMLPAEMRDDETVARFKHAFDLRYNDHYLDKTRPYPGVTELLDVLRSRGAKIAVLSNKPDPFVRKICREAFGENFFDSVQGQVDGMKKKPEPDGVFAILRNLHIDPAETLLVGDSDVDILTGKNAGVASAGVVWGFRGKEELARAGADFLIHDARELLELSPVENS